MADVLSQSQIDALLKSMQGGGGGGEEPQEAKQEERRPASNRKKKRLNTVNMIFTAPESLPRIS